MIQYGLRKKIFPKQAETALIFQKLCDREFTGGPVLKTWASISGGTG